MIGELTVAAAWLADRAPLRALIVTGAGRAFCSGGDVNWFKRGVDDESVDLPSEVRRGAEALHQAIVDIRRIPYPVIAAINGPAAGAGFSLALACDIRIASEEAFLAFAYGRIGASPDGGMTYFLPRVVGPAKALELLLNDPNLDAKSRARSRARRRGRRQPTSCSTAPGRRPRSSPPRPRTTCGWRNGSSHESIETLDHRPPAARAPRDRRQHGNEDLRRGVTAFFAGEQPTFEGD